MKAAVCLSGYLNSKKDPNSKGVNGFLHLKKHVLDKVDCDVFIHSWDMENMDLIKDLYSKYAVSYEFDVQKKFRNDLPTGNGYAEQSSILSQFYSVSKSFSLMRDSEKKYDWVIRSRFDVGQINRLSSGPFNPNNPFAVQCINFDPTLDRNKLYLANWQYFDTEGPPDMWFYSSQENMTKFCDFYDIIDRDMVLGYAMEKWAGKKNNGIVNAIKCWKWALLESGLWSKMKPLETYWE